MLRHPLIRQGHPSLRMDFESRISEISAVDERPVWSTALIDNVEPVLNLYS
jgi:hypothetical protein